MTIKAKLDELSREWDPFTTGEEIANSVTHGIGFLLGVAGLVLLIIKAVIHGTAWHVVGFTIYGSMLVFMYLFSTLYHCLPGEGAKNVFERFDHAGIFLMIAGTYTAITLTNLRGSWGWTIFGIIWGLAIIGIVLKSIFIARFPNLIVALYVGMGWLFIIAFRQMAAHLPPISLQLLIIGNAFYSLGIIYYLWRGLPFSHAIWHLFVLSGSIFHYFSIYLIL